jgi:site-specific DNA recombinase
MSERHSSNGRPSRAAAYYRKSTDEQEQSIDRQKGQVTPYTRSRGYQLVLEEKDEGIAGDVFDKRPGFQRLLQAAQRKEFDVIVVDEPSRLSRQNPIDLIEKVIAPLRRCGVKIDTVSKGPLDYQSLAGIIMMTVHAHKSEDEARDLSRRTIGGIARKSRGGIWFGWMPPYGLRVTRQVDPVTAKVVSRDCVLGPEEEVRAVRFIFDAVANRGWTLRRICRELEDRKVKPPVGNGRGGNKKEGRWNPSTVRKILTNRKYVGDFTWNETHKGKYHAWRDGLPTPEGDVNYRCSRNEGDDVVVVPDILPALIDRDTLARAGVALERSRGRTSPAPGTAGYLFTHLLVCGDCGSFMRGQPDHGHKGYICAKYKEYGSRNCHRNTVAESQLADTILGALRDDILSPTRLDAVEAEVARRLEQERSSGEANRLRARAERLGRDIDQGNRNLALLPPDRLPGVVAQVRSWEEERQGLLTRLGELENGTEEAVALLAEARKQLWRLRDAVADGDVEAQVTVLREVVSKVEIHFDHQHTHGKRSPTGTGRTISRAVKAVVYVRPGLGLSCLDIPATPPTGSAASGSTRSSGHYGWPPRSWPPPRRKTRPSPG